MSRPLFSLAAMKAAAKCLGEAGYPEVVAREAVRAALRTDAPPVPEDAPQSSQSECPRIFWVSGHCGSGKSETTHALQRAAVREGGRAVTLSANEQFHYRWSEDERSIVDLSDPSHIESRAGRQDALASMQIAMEAAKSHTGILLPYLIKNPELLEAAMSIVEECFDRIGMRHTIMVLRESEYQVQMRSDWLRKLQNSLFAQEGFLIVETELACDDTALPIADGDIRLQGRSNSSTPKGAPIALDKLSEGEFLLEGEDGAWQLVEGPYEDFVINPDPAIGAQAHAFLTALETAAARYPRQTHMQRLEMVARVAGYRSWHAAQAHLAKHG